MHYIGTKIETQTTQVLVLTAGCIAGDAGAAWKKKKWANEIRRHTAIFNANLGGGGCGGGCGLGRSLSTLLLLLLLLCHLHHHLLQPLILDQPLLELLSQRLGLEGMKHGPSSHHMMPCPM